MSDSTINAWTKGTWNLADVENIPKDAASSSSNWITQDGRLKLANGRLLIGAEGSAGKISGLHFGYKIDGSKVMYRKISTKVQYFDGTTWQDSITGLTADAEYSFSNYSSLAGAFTFVTGIDGIWKIVNANPASSISLYDSTKNFKGHSLIDKGRMILWDRPEDKTGLYGSWIDRQNSTVYTTVTAEATTSLTGTLAFKAGGAKRSCFGILLTITATGEVYRDTYLGTLIGSLGGTGTINYATGAYTVSNAGVGTVNYQWEDSNVHGITDFTLTVPTRVAGEGFQFPQDVGGDAILNVNVGIDNAYYSIKSQSAYRLFIGATDTATDTTNDVYRRELGLPYWRASTSTSKGIVFMNTANPSNPKLTILRRNEIGTDIEPYPLFPHFDFSKYNYEDCSVDSWDRYIIVFCKSIDSEVNNVILLCDIVTEIVDETKYSGRMSIKDAGSLYIGSSVTESTYQIFNGFDDDGDIIENEWISKGEQYEALGIAESLKKLKKLRIKGTIDPDQKVEVSTSYDGDEFTLVGTIVGSGTYVDYTSPQSIGNNMVGEVQIGGSDLTTVYPFFTEIKIKTPKYRTRMIKFKAIGIGYVSIESLMDRDILIFEKRIPKRFRNKQNVSLDGESTDL